METIGDNVARQSTADEFHAWAAIFARGGGGGFASAMMERCATDNQILSLASGAQPGQPACLLFFGAVTSILLAEPDDPLTPYLLGEPAALKADEATHAALKGFCGRRADQITDIVRSRTVQVTLPRRAGLVPALFGRLMQKGVAEPFSLVEVGSSAGLLTIFDKYYFDFGPLGFLGDPDNLPLPGPRYVGGAPPLPQPMPIILERVGIDLSPVDPSDPDQVRWLEGLTPPGAHAEREELRRALEWRAQIPLKTIADDALKVIPALLPQLPGAAVILHANCLYQWSAELQQRFHEMLLEESRARPIYRLGLDIIHDLPGRPPQASAPSLAGRATDMFVVTYRDGQAEWDYLGICDGIGRQAEWMA